MFKVGQKVWDFCNGWGVVEAIGFGSYPVTIRFTNGERNSYQEDGSYVVGQSRRLFFQEFTPPIQALTPPFEPTFKKGDVIKAVDKSNRFYVYYKVREDTEKYIAVEECGSVDSTLYKQAYTFEKVGEDHS